MDFKLVIFDFDGTLANSFPWFISISQQVAERFQLNGLSEMKPEEILHLDASEMLKTYHIPFWKVAIIGNYVKKMMNQDIHKISLFEGMDDLLKDLHQAGIQLALVSSNSLSNVQQVLGEELCSLISYFECGVSLFGKQGKYKKIVRESGVMKMEALSIGDETRDILAARKADIPGAAVTWGYNHLSILSECQPGFIFESVEDIYQTVLHRSRGYFPEEVHY